MADYRTYADTELAALLKADDRLAFTEIYDRFQGLMYVYACKICKDMDEAEDLVQDVFISLWDKRHTFQVHTSLRAYLYSAVRYKFINLLDHKRVRSHYLESFQRFIDRGEELIDHYIREKEFTALIEKEIALLPQKMREVFMLSRQAGLSNKEIAGRLNITEKTARNQVNNALKQLRIKLGLWNFLLLLLFY